jgi:photosynthetic reaction center cytochrome c subunit
VTLSPRSPRHRPAVAAAVLTAALCAPAFAQEIARPASGPTAAERYKNIQVFKDLPADQLHDAMTYMAATMGGNCQTCHVRGADGEFAYEKDDNDHKVAARQMIQMVRAINTQHFKGESTVTCATCHQGRREPSPVPPLSQPLTADQLAALAQRAAGRQGGAPAAAPAPTGGQARPAQTPAPGGRGAQQPAETVDQVLDKYLDALGGRDAVARLSSRTRRGTLTNRAGQASPLTVEETAGGLIRVTVASTPGIARAVDGAAGWTQSGDRVRVLDGVETVSAGLQADMALGVQIREKYAALAVRAYDRVNGKPVVVLEGRRAAGAAETLYFDRASGLLVRRSARLGTPMGQLPVQIDYDDYHPVDGVQTPFEVRVTDWESVSVQKFSEVAHNQPVDPGRFARPAGR